VREVTQHPHNQQRQVRFRYPKQKVNSVRSVMPGETTAHPRGVQAKPGGQTKPPKTNQDVFSQINGKSMIYSLRLNRIKLACRCWNRSGRPQSSNACWTATKNSRALLRMASSIGGQPLGSNVRNQTKHGNCWETGTIFGNIFTLLSPDPSLHPMVAREAPLYCANTPSTRICHGAHLP
jgi:hypothetical protein